MIAYLRGQLSAKQPNRIVIDVNGVGYDVSVPLSTFYGLGDEGSEVALRIHTHVREDTLALYGFATALEAGRDEAGVVDRVKGLRGFGLCIGLNHAHRPPRWHPHHRGPGANRRTIWHRRVPLSD